MSLPIRNSAGDYVIGPFLSTTLATTLYIPVTVTGRVKSFSVVIGAALTTADETWTLAYAEPDTTTFTNVADGVVKIAYSSSAAGNIAVANINPGTTTYVKNGGVFRITPSGGGGGAVPVSFSIVVGV